MRPEYWLVQWADGAGIHNAHLESLNGAITVYNALRQAGGHIAGTLGVFEVYPDGRTIRMI